MPKAAIVIALALMLLTGLVVGNLHSLAPAKQPVAAAIPPAGGGASRAAVTFYDAVDLFLNTGDASSLRNAVQANFVDHPHLSDEPGTIESFEAWLLAIRESTPDLRFEVSEVISQGDLIAVELGNAGASDTTIAGLPVTVPQASSGYELLRIEGNMVAERWASPALPGLIEPSVASLDGLENAGWIREPRIERFEFSHQSSVSVASHKGTVLIVESGSLNLRFPKPPTNLPVKLEPGAIRAIPPDARFHVWNANREPASLIALTVFQLNPADYYSTGGNDHLIVGGVTRQLLAGGASIRPDHGPFQLQVGHAIAAPGTSIASHKANELELLFVIEGTVEARLEKGWVFSLTEFGGLKTEDEVAAVGPDQAISAGFGAELSYEVTGNTPADFWLITIMPE